MASKAVFLDKDGTLIEDIPYNIDPDRIRLTEGALEGLRLLQQNGYCLIVVTNQSGVARGYFEAQELRPVEKRLRELLLAGDVSLAGFYFCPHHPAGKIAKYAVDCLCRKPRPGMLYQAARQHEIDLPDSWLIGDILHDIEAGNRAGCQTILIDNGHETEWEWTSLRRPRFIVKNLYEAALAITRASLIDLDWSYDDQEYRSIEHD